MPRGSLERTRLLAFSNCHPFRARQQHRLVCCVPRLSYAVGSMCRWLVIAIALVACGDEQLERIQAIKDEVCACKTPACGEAAMKKVPESEIKSNPKTQRVAREMLDCMAKLQDSDRPTADPDAAEPEPQ